MVLVEDTKILSEVVVVGYGVQKKTDLTGAISSIPVDQLASFPTARADQALQGRASGVYVLNTDGSPGGNAMIRIRGLNSINGGNEPLIVIDGLQGGSINSLNPNDIASMEILKDASATAIYGSRGANGVILITTKFGKKGKPVIDAGYNVGIQKLSHKLPVMDAATFAKTFNAYRMMIQGMEIFQYPNLRTPKLPIGKKTEGQIGRMKYIRQVSYKTFSLASAGQQTSLSTWFPETIWTTRVYC